MSDMIQVYDEFAVKHEAAFAAFTRIHEAKNPRPGKSTVKRDLVSMIIVFALAVVMAAAVIVSSSRTIDEFGGGAIGATAFVMIEGGIMVYALFRARRTASTARLQKTVKWATAGLILTFVIGVGANIDATLRHKGIVLPTEFNIFINFLVAISAPTLAFISSDVLAIELMATEIKRRDADSIYERECREWQEGLNRSWASNQKNWGVKIEVPAQAQIEAENPVNYSNLQSNTRFVPSRKLQLALDYFQLHPEHLGEESRKLQDVIGVSHTTVNKAQRMLRGQDTPPITGVSPHLN